MNILHLDASPQGIDASSSRKLSAATVAQLVAKNPGAKVVVRDLATNAPGHLSGLEVGAFFTPPEARNDAMKAAMVQNDEILNEFLAADVIVIGTPMYNFGVTSSVKAWIDRVVRAGITFKYTETGAYGLDSSGKKLYVLSSRGGVYSNTDWGRALDHQEQYLQDILGFLGIKECVRIRAEGTAMGEAALKGSMDAAMAQIAAI